MPDNVNDSPATKRWSRIPPAALLLVAIASVQSGGALATRLFAALGPIGTVSVRVTVSAIVLLAVWRPRIRRAEWRSLIPVLAFGATIAGMNSGIYASLTRIPLGVAVTLEFIGPLTIAVLHSRRPRDFAWAALAGIGVLLLTPLTGTNVDPIGVLLALGAGVCWAGYSVLGARVGALYPGGSGLALGVTAAAALVWPFSGGAVTKVVHNPGLLAWGCLIALLSTLIPFSLEFEALKRMPQRTYGVLVSLDPAAAAIAGMVLIGQPITARAFIAVACVVAAALGVTLSRETD